MDQLHFHCPACQQPTAAPIGQVGQTAHCAVCGQMIVIPGTPGPAPNAPMSGPPRILHAMPQAIPMAQTAVEYPPVPYQDAPLKIDLTAGVPGLARRGGRTSSSYRLTEKRIGIGHRPGTTFGHAFGGSFGCVFGFYMAVLAATIIFAVVAALINAST